MRNFTTNAKLFIRKSLMTHKNISTCYDKTVKFNGPGFNSETVKECQVYNIIDPFFFATGDGKIS